MYGSGFDDLTPALANRPGWRRLPLALAVLLAVAAAGPAAVGAKTTVTYTLQNLGAYEVSEIPQEVMSNGQCLAQTSRGAISALSDEGTVIGSRPKSNYFSTPVLITSDGTTRLKTGGVEGNGLDISPDGTVVVGVVLNDQPDGGVCGPRNGLSYSATEWVNGKRTTLKVPDGFDNAAATKIAADGEVLGSAWRGQTRGYFVWKQGVPAALAMPATCDDGTANVDRPAALASGDLVVGRSCGQAAIWRGGALTTLAGLPGSTSASASAVNRQGIVVGFSLFEQNGVRIDVGTVWSADGTPTLVGGRKADETLFRPAAINDAGVIAGDLARGNTSAGVGVVLDGDLVSLQDAFAGTDLVNPVTLDINESGQILCSAGAHADDADASDNYAVVLTPKT